MADRTLILHVGYPKTGTTTLQGGLFERLDGVAFFGKRTSGRDAFRSQWMPRLRNLVNDGHGYHVRQSAGALAKEIQNDLRVRPEEAALISLEGFTNPFVDTTYPLLKDVFTKAEHLHEIVAPLIAEGIRVRILVTVRRQTELIPSLFSQVYLHAQSAGLVGKSYQNFLDFLFDDDLIGPGPAFRFDKLLEHYGQLFGVDAVYAAAMEDLFGGGMTEAVARLAEAFNSAPETCLSLIGNQKLNARRGGGSGDDRRRMLTGGGSTDRVTRLSGIDARRAAFGTRDRLRLMMGRPIYRTLDDASRRIETYYAASNERLSKRFGISL